jgi:hypothetical protein
VFHVKQENSVTDTSKPAQKATAPKPSDTPVVVADQPEGASIAPVAGEVPDPRVGSDSFTEGDQKGFQGRHGFDLQADPLSSVSFVDPDNIRADVTPGVQPDSGGDALLAAAQEKAPNLTADFVKAYKLTDQNLADIANGSVPPPPAIGPEHTSDLYLTPGGWQQTPPGITPDAYASAQTERSRR